MNDSKENPLHLSLSGKASVLYSEVESSSLSGGSTCLECGKETANPKFCSLSCSATRQQRKRREETPIPSKECAYCKQNFTYGPRSNSPRTSQNKFCSHSCSAKSSNSKRAKGKSSCPICSQPVLRTNSTYCSQSCAVQRFYKDNIKEWLAGEQDGLSSNGTVTPWVKRWLRETRGDACEICGWAEVNPFTGKRPLVADHIDGNWKNNRPENLKLICPNCDSLQATYKAANKGKGRPNRRANGNN